MEHEHHEHEHHQYSQSHGANRDNILPISVIISAVLISASIFYNTKLILQQFNRQATGKANIGADTGNLAPNAPAVPGDLPNAADTRVEVKVRSDAPVLGQANAKVNFVEFVDFQCPFCQRFYNEAYQQIKSKYVDSGKVKITFRHFPLSFHVNAQKAAEAAECANRQGKFIVYHDLLFKKMQPDGTGLDTQSLKQYARDLGLDAAEFNRCLDGGEMAAVVQGDITDGSAVGVSGTPTMFINGKKIVGAQPYAVFEQAIEEVLK